MMYRSCCLVLGLAALSHCFQGHAQISKGHQILIDRGFQVQGLVNKDDVFHLSTYTNANYNSLVWLWTSNPSLMGAAPGFPWSRWAADETLVPPQTGEAPYLSQLVTLQLGDEWNLNDGPTLTRLVNWFNAVRANWPNTILCHNNYGGQLTDTNLGAYVTYAQPDMLSFDTYPYWYDGRNNSVGDTPIHWYGDLRRWREFARGANIPLACYVQTYHSVSEGVRDPSASELRLLHFGAMAFNVKALIDFTYNTGASSLFNNGAGGDNSPNALYTEKADCAKRARNLGKALVRLKPIAEASPTYTTSIMFLRGRDFTGNINPIPIGFNGDDDAPNDYTDWIFQRNDPYLNGWSVTNKAGLKNGGTNGDVIISWFKPLDESFDGAATNEVYLMVVNALCASNGTPAECLQEIKLNFLDAFPSIDMLDPVSGQLTNVPLPVVNSKRQLTLNLNGGDAALFKFADGAPFVGFPFSTNAPGISSPPASRTNFAGTDETFNVTATGAAPLSYRWRFNDTTIAGATTNSYTRANVQTNDAGSYTVVVTNTSGSVTSAVTTLTVIPNQVFLYEPFDYPNVGSPVSSNTPANWTFGGTGTNDLNVTAGNLSYPGLATPISNSVTNGGVGLGVRRSFGTGFTNGQLYFSALFRINNLGLGTWLGTASQAGALTANDTNSFRMAVLVKSNSPSGYVLGVQKGGTGVTAAFDSTEYHAGDIMFLVGKYDFDASPNTVALWINPSAATFGLGTAPGGSISTNTGTDGFTIDRFNIRQNTATSVPAAMQWDELRIGNSWAAVTPIGPFPTVLSNLTRLSDGKFQFAYAYSGSGGTIYASTNLTNWSVIGAATLVSAGNYQFTDPAASNYLRRFYQLRTP